ncbi:MAG: MgtC/SapB family protein [Pseudomonadota bacterium]
MKGLDFFATEALDLAFTFGIAIAIGLLLGLERERRPEAKAGLRTFALASLLGAVCALLSDRSGAAWILAAGLLVVGLMTSAAYLREREPDADPGTTTVVAISVAYALGAMVWYGFTTEAVMLAIVTTILLYFKTELEDVSRALTRRDLISILQFAVLSFIVLPILPERDFGPYDALNLYQIWLMVVLISGVSLAGYIALRFVGQTHGALLLGAFGGLVSSTATTLVYARHGGTHPELSRLAVVVVLLANAVVLFRIGIVTAAVSAGVLPQLLPMLTAGALAALGAAAFGWRKLRAAKPPPLPEIGNPTEIKTAVTFGVLYAAVLLLAAWLSDYAGSKGLYAVALVSGLTDVDAITLSSLRLQEIGRIADREAVVAIGLATIANLAFKAGLAFAVGGRGLGLQCLWGFGATMLAVAAALFATG